MLPPAAVRTLPELRATVAAWRREGLRVGLVPTMGALHDGHLALMRHALARADRVVASVFVNPTQFGPGEDLDRYPRDEPGDLARLAEVGVQLAWLPPVEAMYPPGDRTRVTVEGLGDGLEAVARPHFFRGVATVVAKLLNQVRPDLAVFGEKDYQQLLVVRRLARDLAIPAEILAHPTVREPDGLAMSSRNRYLAPAERAVAPALHRVLAETARTLADGRLAAEALATGTCRLLAAGFARVDYLELRDAEDLAPLDRVARPPAGGRPAERDPADRQRAGPASVAVALFELDGAGYRRRARGTVHPRRRSSAVPRAPRGRGAPRPPRPRRAPAPAPSP